MAAQVPSAPGPPSPGPGVTGREDRDYDADVDSLSHGHVAGSAHRRSLAASKRNITHRGPLLQQAQRSPVHSRSEALSDDEVKRAVLLISLEAAKALPRKSAYARHRVACIGKALQLLDIDR